MVRSRRREHILRTRTELDFEQYLRCPAAGETIRAIQTDPIMGVRDIASCRLLAEHLPDVACSSVCCSRACGDLIVTCSLGLKPCRTLGGAFGHQTVMPPLAVRYARLRIACHKSGHTVLNYRCSHLDGRDLVAYGRIRNRVSLNNSSLT